MKTFHPVLSALIVSAVLCSCQKTDIANNNAADAIAFNVKKTVALELINNVRKTGCNCGGQAMPPVPVIVWNDQLGQAAYNHSKDMKDNNYFSHTGLDGSTPGNRITMAGYNWITYGENIAMGYIDEKAVVDAWLSSDGHCRNIMNANFKEMGMGLEGNYWTEVFGAK